MVTIVAPALLAPRPPVEAAAEVVEAVVVDPEEELWPNVIILTVLLLQTT